MLESLEGKRGVIRFKPPLPAIQGLFGKPTIISNVISFASVPVILDRGAEFYKEYGMGRSRGTLPFQLAGNIKCGGLVEKAFGITLRELLYDYGGASATGRPTRAVQVGGPLGAYLPESQFDTPMDYEAFAKIGAMVGHSGVVAFDDMVDMARMARYANETAKFVHVFLPGSSFLEKDGTFTNAERRISPLRKVMPPLAGKADWEVTAALSNALGYPMNYAHPSEIMDEIARLTPTFAGVSYEKLDRLGSIQWPCNDSAPDGTPVMHAEQFVRGKGRFMIT